MYLVPRPTGRSIFFCHNVNYRLPTNGSSRPPLEELRQELRRGRATYTELEESDADLARHQKWLAAIRARDYFDAPGGEEAVAAVASCEDALARFESDALSAELDERPAESAPPGLRAVEGD